MSKRKIGELWYNGISLDEHSVVVDIGAYTGEISLYALREFGVKWVYAIEASRKNYEILCKACYGKPNVTLINAAIGPKNGELTFYEYDELPIANSLIKAHPKYSRDWFPGGTKETGMSTCSTVRSLTIRSFLDEMQITNIDLLIMNCEGAEMYVLSEMAESLELMNRIRYVSVVFHPSLLGQRRVMRLIMLLACHYEPRIVTRDIRGPHNVIFSRRKSPIDISLSLRIQYMLACVLDAMWPLLRFAQKCKERLSLVKR